MTAADPAPDPAAEREALAERVSAAVLAFPGVAGAHGGRYNDIATFRPGGRLVGVRIGDGDEPVEVGVVLRLDRPIPEVVAELRRTVSRLCGGAAVDVTVGDVSVGPQVDPAAHRPVAPAPGPGRMVR